jgi:hypothetical protein
MTKPFSLLAVLVGVLLLSSGGCIALCLWYVRILSAGETLQAQARQLEAPAVALNRNRALFQAIAADAVEFAKKNPQMNTLLQQHGPLLEELNVKPKSTPARTEPTPKANPPAASAPPQPAQPTRR